MEKLLLYLLMISVAVVPLTVVHSLCIHDRVQAKVQSRAELNYGVISTGHRLEKRGAGSHRGPPHRHPPFPREGYRASEFYPIRLSVQYHDLDMELSNLEVDMVKRIIQTAVSKVQDIFSVRPVNGKLLLGRSETACVGHWQDGPNAGRCSKINPGYSGETCMDRFRIPEEHVEGLAEWKYADSNPSNTYAKTGAGIANTDFILYVKARSTASCLETDQMVIAYGSYCHLDQYSRPISGVINLCPDFLKSSSCDEKKAAITIVHELFHTLGFSADLFTKYRDITKNGTTTHMKPVQYIRGVPRLMTPRAIQFTRNHFNCFDSNFANEFGPILDQKNGIVFSHWDAAFLQGSIMVPNLGVSHLTFLDAITLAVFEDTGWYKINYLHAQSYQWGKGAGCSFATEGSCDDSKNSKYFCEGSNMGCHYMHLDKGRCETDPYLYGCRIYKAKKDDTCRSLGSRKPEVGEIFQFDSRCFISNLTSQILPSPISLTGRCFQHRCVNGKDLEVRTGNSIWCRCMSDTVIQIPNYHGVVKCPDNKILCQPQKKHRLDAKFPMPEPESTNSHEENSKIMCIELIFRANFRELWQSNNLEPFKKEVAKEVAKRTLCASSRLTDIYVYEGNHAAVYRFNLKPSMYSTDGPNSQKVYDILMAHVNAGNFSVYVEQLMFAHAVRSVPMDPMKSENSVSVALIAGIIAASVVVAIVIGILVFFVQRYYALQSHIQNSYADYPPPLTSQQQAANQQNVSNTQGSHAGSEADCSYSDLVSYHSDMENYPVSNRKSSSNQGSLISNSAFSGCENLALNIDDIKDKMSVCSSGSSGKMPSVIYVSTVSIGDEVDETECAVNQSEKSNKVFNRSYSVAGTSHTDHKPFGNDNQSYHLDQNRNSCNCNNTDICSEGEHKIVEPTIRERTFSETMLSKDRTKSSNGVDDEIKSHSNNIHNIVLSNKNVSILPVNHTPNTNRNSVVSISTVSSNDRSLSDIKLSTASSSVFADYNGYIPHRNGDYNQSFHKENDTHKREKRDSVNTYSTIISDRDSFNEVHDEISPAIKTELHNSLKDGGAVSNKVSIITKNKHCNLNKSSSKSTGRINCCGHEPHKKKKNFFPSLKRKKSRNTSVSSASSVSSNCCSECDSCQSCKESRSSVSSDTPDKRPFVSVIDTANYAGK